MLRNILLTYAQKNTIAVDLTFFRLKGQQLRILFSRGGIEINHSTGETTKQHKTSW